MAVLPGRPIKAPFVTTGNPDTVNDAPSSATTVGSSYNLSGQLGAVLATSDGQREYIYAKLDTDTALTPAANQVLFWKTRSSYLLTNKLANSLTNEPAGILRNAATAGNYVWALRKGAGIAVKYGGAGASANDVIIAKAASTAADSTSVAAATAPTNLMIGVATASSSGGNVTTDVDIE